MHPAQIEISLRILAVRIFTGRILDSNDAMFLHADDGDRSDCAEAPADFHIPWAHMSEGRFTQFATVMAFPAKYTT